MNTLFNIYFSQTRQFSWQDKGSTTDANSVDTGKNKEGTGNAERRGNAAPLLGRQLIQVVMGTAGEVGLQDLCEQAPLQQVVGHGEQLSDHLVEVLWDTVSRH